MSESDKSGKPELTVCKRCHGQGFTLYGSTATWHGGIGGAAMTEDVCDKCWGTGYISHPGPNRRRGEHPTTHAQRIKVLESERSAAQARIAELEAISKALIKTLQVSLPIVSAPLRETFEIAIAKAKDKLLKP